LGFLEAAQPTAGACRKSLTPLVPGEEHIHRAPDATAESLGLHSVNHTQEDSLQQFRFEQTEKVDGGDLRIG
jgi:hypothetical protein